MTSTSFAKVRRDLDSVFDRVVRDHEPLLLTREEGGDVVILSAEDYGSLEETAYLLHSPANARRLLEAVASDRAGETGRSLESVLAELGLEDEELDEG